MNYASMIEEEHLKKGFIIATLISTVIGTFTTSIGLYERVRDRHIQHKKDTGQDGKIKELERRADAADRARRRAEREKNEHVKGRSRSLGWDEQDLRDELAASGPMIRREYDRNYSRFGSRFAEGDQIAQNELQAQIIEMQASVIRLLQDALVNGTMPDPAALYSAAGRARNGSIRALNDQHQRMLAAAPINNRGTVYIPGGGNSGTGRRALRSSSVASASTKSSHAELVDRRRSNRDYGRDRGRERLIGDDDYAEDEDDRDFRRRDVDRQRRSMSQATAGTRRASKFPVQLPANPRAADALSTVVAAQPPLFCRYSIQLQKDWRRPLALGSEDGSSHSEMDFDGNADGDLICPACMGSFAIEHDRSWKMHKPVVVGEEIQQVKDTDARDDADGASNADGDRTVATTTHRKNIVELVQDRLFVVSNRFIVKCHRPAAYDGLENTLLPPSYACSLCDRFDADGKVTLCSSMARLVNHVCEKHSVGELLSDPDIREIRGRAKR
ncbi:hypothetical protein F503_05650 [Ophiostoma piceae UAMH 11346]|uniref:Uncharacterized protein n=1 Tax=Ophiostoma piceae (strain UAMH 11346) TaxID=1262450 RepID=S3DAJ0_OPHP1|nr:hypothetical protein F503_05650 [Ophiostoma piceae UAMH 11346]